MYHHLRLSWLMTVVVSLSRIPLPLSVCLITIFPANWHTDLLLNIYFALFVNICSGIFRQFLLSFFWKTPKGKRLFLKTRNQVFKHVPNALFSILTNFCVYKFSQMIAAICNSSLKLWTAVWFCFSLLVWFS